MNVFNTGVLLRFMQLFSANSPLGNFNYSHGLEFAVERGWVCSKSNFTVWQKELMNSQLVYLDLPILHRFYHCIECNDIGLFLYYLEKLLSFRETYELRMEEKDRGEIIVRLIFELGLQLSSSWKRILERSMLASITWIGYMWKIPVDILCMGYSYHYLENNVISGLKLIPFGQFEAQKLIMFFLKLLPTVLKRSSVVTDDELGSSFPLQEIASSCHEAQHIRLFRS